MMKLVRKKGFTLLELMIVVIIIGILASLALPRFIDATRRARESEARSILGSMRASQLRYYLQYSAYTAAIGSLDLGLTANPSTYYTYSSLNGANVGQAAAIGGHGLSNFRINALTGAITTY
ncbi:MAG: prepilin-type N-terminal cleavage/methylation domain-containing protein [Candidatus Omnitrophota bacterium]